MNGVNNILEQFKNLRSDTTHDWDERTKGRAPHKPFLLLSILDGIEQGWIEDNRIYPTQNLIEGFFRYWDSIMGSDRTTTVALPYFHMKSESFWSLEYKSERKAFTYSPSWGAIKERIEYAVMDEVLFSFLESAEGLEQTRNFLSELYFGDVTAIEISRIGNKNQTVYALAEKLKLLAAEPFAIDHSAKADQEYREGKVQDRDQAFCKVIRENYRYTCAVCKSIVNTPGGKTLVEGAHIIPWSLSKNNDPRNGISMCPNHHWMFDSYMLTIRPDYSLSLSKWLKNSENEVTDILQRNGDQILLPETETFYPAEEALLDHNNRFEEFHEKWK